MRRAEPEHAVAIAERVAKSPRGEAIGRREMFDVSGCRRQPIDAARSGRVDAAIQILGDGFDVVARDALRDRVGGESWSIGPDGLIDRTSPL